MKKPNSQIHILWKGMRNYTTSNRILWIKGMRNTEEKKKETISIRNLEYKLHEKLIIQVEIAMSINPTQTL